MDISLIIPCYNEELNLQKGVLDQIGNYTAQHPQFKEVLIVDDGSTDSTKDLITGKYLPKFSKFKLIEKNHQGKALAVIEGIKQSKSDFVIFTDMDLATPLEESEKFIHQFSNGEKIVIGSRAHSREGAPFMRKLQSVGFMIIRNLLVGLDDITDTQCGFKGFERKAALQVISKLQAFSDTGQPRNKNAGIGIFPHSGGGITGVHRCNAGCLGVGLGHVSTRKGRGRGGMI